MYTDVTRATSSMTEPRISTNDEAYCSSDKNTMFHNGLPVEIKKKRITMQYVFMVWFKSSPSTVRTVASMFLPKSALILIYNALAHSKLVYCIDAWENAPATHLQKLFVVQKNGANNL